MLRLFLELATAGGGAGCRWCSASPARSTGCCWRRTRAIPLRLAAAVARRERGRGAARRPHAPRAWWRTACPDRPEDLGAEAAGRLRGLLALRDELAAVFPGALLTIDLAEFARNSLDPRLAVAEGERPYYDGLVFHAYAGPAALPVGGGGRYDRLFRALGAEVPAVGFSLSLERLLESRAVIRLALPKGRNLEAALAAFRAAGIPSTASTPPGREPAPARSPRRGSRCCSLKDWDLPLYVGHGVADCGIVGSDVLEEMDGDLLVPVRLPPGALPDVAHRPRGRAARAPAPRCAWRPSIRTRRAASWPGGPGAPRS